jgi:hypothetical protein
MSSFNCERAQTVLSALLNRYNCPEANHSDFNPFHTSSVQDPAVEYKQALYTLKQLICTTKDLISSIRKLFFGNINKLPSLHLKLLVELLLDDAEAKIVNSFQYEKQVVSNSKSKNFINSIGDDLLLKSFNFLDQKAVSAVSRVSKFFSRNCARLLWKEVDISTSITEESIGLDVCFHGFPRSSMDLSRIRPQCVGRIHIEPCVSKIIIEDVNDVNFLEALSHIRDISCSMDVWMHIKSLGICCESVRNIRVHVIDPMQMELLSNGVFSEALPSETKNLSIVLHQKTAFDVSEVIDMDFPSKMECLAVLSTAMVFIKTLPSRNDVRMIHLKRVQLETDVLLDAMKLMTSLDEVVMEEFALTERVSFKLFLDSFTSQPKVVSLLVSDSWCQSVEDGMTGSMENLEVLEVVFQGDFDRNYIPVLWPMLSKTLKKLRISLKSEKGFKGLATNISKVLDRCNVISDVSVVLKENLTLSNDARSFLQFLELAEVLSIKSQVLNLLLEYKNTRFDMLPYFSVLNSIKRAGK